MIALTIKLRPKYANIRMKPSITAFFATNIAKPKAIIKPEAKMLLTPFLPAIQTETRYEPMIIRKSGRIMK